MRTRPFDIALSFVHCAPMQSSAPGVLLFSVVQILSHFYNTASQ
jgi:hypothetical protein